MFQIKKCVGKYGEPRPELDGERRNCRSPEEIQFILDQFQIETWAAEQKPDMNLYGEGAPAYSQINYISGGTLQVKTLELTYVFIQENTVKLADDVWGFR